MARTLYQCIQYRDAARPPYLSKNYININVNNLKSKLSSSTIEYCKQFIKNSKKFNFDLIEIHNRPLVFRYLKSRIETKYILYFHNDPLSMKGSKTLKERQILINSVDKIIFVSKWVQKRFVKICIIIFTGAP